MNYVQLKAAIQNFAEDFGDNFNAYLDTFIKQAEQRIYNTCQLPASRKSATVSIVAGTQYFPVPSGFLSVHELAVITASGYQYLLNKDVSFIRESYPNPATTGAPKYYAVFNDTQLLMAPTADQNYQTEIHYFGYPTSIVDAGTSWLGDNFETALMYGALFEAAVFDKLDQDMVTYYKSQFDAALVLLKQLSEGKNTQDDYRSGHVRAGVA